MEILLKLKMVNIDQIRTKLLEYPLFLHSKCSKVGIFRKYVLSSYTDDLQELSLNLLACLYMCSEVGGALEWFAGSCCN